MDAFHVVFLLLGLLVALGGWRLYRGLTRLLRLVLGDVIIGPAVFILAGFLLAARLRTLEMSWTNIGVTLGICAALALGIRFAVRDMYVTLFFGGGLAVVLTCWLVLFPQRPRELVDVFRSASLPDLYRNFRIAVTPSGLDLLVLFFGGVVALLLRRYAVVYITALVGSAMVGFGRHSLLLAVVVFGISVLHQYLLLEYRSDDFWQAMAPEKKQTGVW